MKNEGINSTNNKNFELPIGYNLSSIFENTSDSVWAINSEYEILYANHVFVSAFFESFGVQLKPGINLLLSLPKSIRNTWQPRYDRAISNEGYSFVDEVKTNDGSIYIEVFMNPIVVEDEVIGAMCFGKDISKRKQDEKALVESQLLLKSSLESQKDTILFSINKNYEYLYFNSAHVDGMRFAYGKEIAMWMNALDCISLESDRIVAKENYDRALRGESHSNIRMYGEENTAFYESFFNPIKNEKNEIIGATGLARNISNRKKAEQALLNNEKELKELISTKDKLFSIIGHDLRSPFNNILGFLEMLLERVNDNTFTDTEKYLNYVYDSASSTMTILDNLLEWAKAQTGKLKFNPEQILLSDIIHEVIKLKMPFAEAKNISLSSFTTDQVQVYADPNLLKTVLRNLISNAIKFTERNGEICISAKEKEACVEITISDNGVGIKPERMKALFQVSSNSSTIGTASETGSGLGLLLCKECVEKHKGTIWAISEVGKGSEFKFTLPTERQTDIPND